MRLVHLFILATALIACSSKKTEESATSGTINQIEQEEGQLNDQMDQIEKELDSAMSESTSKNPLKLEGNSDYETAGDLRSIHFGYNSNSLGESERLILQQVAQFLEKMPKIHIQIEGHCDERGGIQYNLALGEKRAKEVKSYLINLGVSEDRLSTISYGKEMPLAFENDEKAWTKNRRANFRVIKF